MGIDLNNTVKGDQLTGQILENESNTTFESLAGFGSLYGSKEARLAVAIADAGGGSSGGGSGTSATTIAAGIDQSIDISEIIANTQALEDKIGNELNEVAVSSLNNAGTVLGRLRGVQRRLEGLDAQVINDFNFIATAVNEVASAADINCTELYVQNKSDTDIVYIRNNGEATPELSITLFPGGSHVFTGFEAQQALNAISSVDVLIYIKRTNIA